MLLQRRAKGLRLLQLSLRIASLGAFPAHIWINHEALARFESAEFSASAHSNSFLIFLWFSTGVESVCIMKSIHYTAVVAGPEPAESVKVEP